jgi:hypothetical protein
MPPPFVLALLLPLFVLFVSQGYAAAPQSPIYIPALPQHTVLPVSADESVISIRILSRSVRGDTVDVMFALELSGLPTDKSYQFFMQDMGMQQSGLPPVPVPDSETRFRIDQNGALSPFVPAFNLNGFARGEWVRFIVRSTDGTISESVRFIPLK